MSPALSSLFRYFATSLLLLIFKLPTSSSSPAPASYTRSPDTISPHVPGPPRPAQAEIPIPSAPASNPQTSCAARSSRLPRVSVALFQSAVKMRSPHTLHPMPLHEGFSSPAPASPLSSPVDPAGPSASDSPRPASTARQSSPFPKPTNVLQRTPPPPHNSIPSPHTPASSRSENPK